MSDLAHTSASARLCFRVSGTSGRLGQYGIKPHFYPGDVWDSMIMLGKF